MFVFQKGWLLYHIQPTFLETKLTGFGRKKKRVCLAPSLPFYFCHTPVNSLVISVSELNVFFSLPFTVPCWGYEQTEEKLLGKESLDLISDTHVPPLSLV